MGCCSICGSKESRIIYHGPIRIGQGSRRTEKSYDVYQCLDCDTIWHENDTHVQNYYESTQYRMELEGTADIDNFYINHDKECLDKFLYTGTDIFRGKIVADIGCGGGGWLDFLKDVASITIAVEPSKTYQKHLKEKGHITYAYMSDAIKDYSNSVDVLTSFDVIEHVTDPHNFVHDIFRLVSGLGGGVSGRIIVGTPTDLKHLRQLLGIEFDSFVFSVQHPWIFSEKGLHIIFEKAGFKNIRIKHYMRYGLGNVFAWLKERSPRGHITYPCISSTMEEAWKCNLAEIGYGDYLVVYATK
jgi:2-polyprenyl-3-methyl-5-hydroxy-6-metoxy-1,4-benzoquinol methylase